MATTKNVDFSNVKDGGNFNRSRIPAGDYLATISKVEDAEAKDGTFQYLFSIKLKNRPSSVFPYYCKLQENQLWKLRNLLIAAGISVPKKRTKVDPNRAVGKLIGVTIEDDEYDGREQSTVAGVFPAAELDGLDSAIASEDDDDESIDEDEVDIDLDEDEDESEEAGEDFSKLSRAELKERIRQLKPDFLVKKSMTDDDLRGTLTELTGGSSAADEDDDEEEEPPAKPARKTAASKRKTTEVSDDELDELDIDDL